MGLQVSMNNMKPLTLSVLAILLAGCDSERIAKLEKENNELRESIKTAAVIAKLELQGKCANQAKASYAEGGWLKEQLATYTNHYNPKLTKCFMEVQSTTVQGGDVFNNKYVSDAYEGKNYAEYAWKAEKGKKYWEVAPFMCKVEKLSGEVVYCKTTEEFEELVKQFME